MKGNSRKYDSLEVAALAVMVMSALFVATFFWQVAAGAAGSEESFREKLVQESKKRMARETGQISFLLDMEKGGQAREAFEEGLKRAGSFHGNSQFHLFLGRMYRERTELGPAIGEYRRAVESNRDLSDRRSPYFLGDILRPLVKEGREVFLGGEAQGDVLRGGVVDDLYFLERSLAGGCH